jgi:hypothetical protein
VPARVPLGGVLVLLVLVLGASGAARGAPAPDEGWGIRRDETEK